MKREKSLVTVRSGPVITKKKTAYKQPTARTRIHYCIICGRASFRPFVRSVRQPASSRAHHARHTHTPLTPTLYLALCLASVATSPWSRLTN